MLDCIASFDNTQALKAIKAAKKDEIAGLGAACQKVVEQKGRVNAMVKSGNIKTEKEALAAKHVAKAAAETSLFHEWSGSDSLFKWFGVEWLVGRTIDINDWQRLMKMRTTYLWSISLVW